MKKTFHPKWLLSILCLMLIYGSAFSQTCTDVEDCVTNLDNPYASAVFDPISPLTLCGDPVMVKISFDQFVPAALQYCPFIVCLNPNGGDGILYDGLPSNSPYTTNSTSGSSGSITFTFLSGPSGPIPPPLEFFIKPNCDLWENISTGALLNNTIQFNSCVNGPEIQCLRALSPPFDILHSEIRLGEANDINNVAVKEPFDLSIPMEISGANCIANNQSEVGVSVDFDQDIDLTNATVCVEFSNPNYEGATFTPVVSGNTIDLMIHPDDFNGVNAFCANTFPDGMGEATLTIKGLIISSCPEPIMRVDYSVDNCTSPPTGCIPNGCISTATSYLFMDKGTPELEMTWDLENAGLDFCEGFDPPTIVRYTITNTSDDFATDINVLLAFPPNLVDIRRFRVGDSDWFPNNISGANTFNNTYNQAGNCDIINESNVAANAINFNFICHDNNIPLSELGLDDPDCNFAFADLAPGEQFFIYLAIEARCPAINPDACGPPIIPPVPTIAGSVSWNNECHSLDEDQLMSSGLTNPGDPFILGGPPPELNFACGDSPDVEFNDVTRVNFCYPAWDFSGITNPLFVHTAENMEQVLTVDMGANANFQFIELFLNGVSLGSPIPSGGGVFFIDISNMNVPPTEERCFEAVLRLNCFQPQAGGETVNFSTNLTGSWDECDPAESCEIDFGVMDTELYQFCRCFPGGDDWDCRCERVETTGFSPLRRTADPNVTSCGAYLCDQIEMVITGNILAIQGQQAYQIDNLFGGITYERINGVDIFNTNNTIAFFEIQDHPNVPVTFIPSPVQETGGAYDDNNTFSLNFSAQFSPLIILSDRTIRLVIRTQINEAAIDALGTLNPPRYVYPIRDFRGYLGTIDTPGQEDNRCTGAGTAQFFNLYRVLSGTGLTNAVASCNDGLLSEPGMALGYCGGSNGDEFPQELRPINRYIDDMTIRLEGADGSLLPNLGIESILVDDHDGSIFTISVEDDLGLPPFQNTITIPSIEDFLPDPVDKDQFSNSRELKVTFNGSLACDVDEVFVHFIGSSEINTFARDQSCRDYIPIDEIAVVNVLGGGVNTFPLNPEITTACLSSVDSDATPLSVWVEAPGMDANFAVLYFDLTGINTQILIDPVPPADPNTPDLFSSEGTDGNFRWFVFADPVPLNGMEVQFDYTILNCNPTTIELPFSLYKQCISPIDEPPTLPFEESEACLSMNNFKITVLPSDLEMSVFQCVQPIDYCSPAVYSVLIENPSQGSVQDLAFQLSLPDNMTLVSAQYRYDNNFTNTNSCGGSGYNEIDVSQVVTTWNWTPGDLLSNTNPAGGLPGFKMMEGDGYRQLHLLLEVEMSCDVVLGSDELTFLTTAISNCGDQLKKEAKDETGHISQSCASSNIELSCSELTINDNMEWNLVLNVDGAFTCPFDVDIETLATNTITSTPNVLFNSNTDIITITGISIIGSDGFAVICPPDLTISITSDLCMIECPVTLSELHIPANGVVVSSHNCIEDGECITTTFTNEGCFPVGEGEIHFEYYCNTDCNYITPTNNQQIGVSPLPETGALAPGESVTITVCDDAFAECDGCVLIKSNLEYTVGGQGGQGARCPIPNAITSCEPCPTPQDLACELIDPETLELSWTDLSGPGNSYEVHIVGNSPDCNCSSSLGTVLPSNGTELELGPDYIDQCFSWYVVSLCDNGLSSEASDIMCYYPGSGCAPPPFCPAPTNLTCEPNDLGVLEILSWDLVPEAAFYQVYYTHNNLDCGCESNDTEEHIEIVSSGSGNIPSPTIINVNDLEEFDPNNPCISWFVTSVCFNELESAPSETMCYNPVDGCTEPNMEPEQEDCFTIIQSSDDATEDLSNDMVNINSQVLTFSDGNVIGLRFKTIGIPASAEITSAYIEFKSASDYNPPMIQQIYPINPDGFSSTDPNATFDPSIPSDISERPAFNTNVIWDTAPWEFSYIIQTSDITELVEAIIASQNYDETMIFAFTKDGPDSNPISVKSFDGWEEDAPKLCITYKNTEVEPEPELCPAPQNLACFSQNGTNLTWEPISGAYGYMVEVIYGDQNCGCLFGAGEQPEPLIGEYNTILNLANEGIQNQCFSWRVRTICSDGTPSTFVSEMACYDPSVGCSFFQLSQRSELDSPLTQQLSNLNVFPNPTSGKLTITYGMQKAKPLRIKIMNVEGKLVKEITNEDFLSKDFRYTWNIEERLTDGVYFIHLETDTEVIQQKFVLIR